MTDQEFQDIKLIAEFDGFSNIFACPINNRFLFEKRIDYLLCGNLGNEKAIDLPDYRNDLNAIVQVAEKICDKLGNRWRFCVHSPMKIDSHYNKYEAYFEDYQGNEDESVGLALEPSLSEALFQACLKVLDYLKQAERR